MRTGYDIVLNKRGHVWKWTVLLHGREVVSDTQKLKTWAMAAARMAVANLKRANSQS